MSGIYKHFKDTDPSNNAFDEAKYKTGLRNPNQNYGGTAGADTTTKVDKNDLKENKIMDQVKTAYEKYVKR